MGGLVAPRPALRHRQLHAGDRAQRLVDLGLGHLLEVAVLQHIERDSYEQPMDAARCEELLHRLSHVEATVTKLNVPPAFGDLLYGLRSHIAVVRAGLLERRAAV